MWEGKISGPENDEGLLGGFKKKAINIELCDPHHILTPPKNLTYIIQGVILNYFFFLREYLGVIEGQGGISP